MRVLRRAHEAAPATVAAPGPAPMTADVDSSTVADVTRLRERLAAAEQLAAGLDCALAAKADAGAVERTLGAVHRQLARLDAAKLDRGALSGALAAKVDRRDLERVASQGPVLRGTACKPPAQVAARLAGGGGDDDPALVAKWRVPGLRCVACDRPLKGAPRLGVAVAPTAFEDLGPAAARAPPVDATAACAAAPRIASLGRGSSAAAALAAARARPRSAENRSLLDAPHGALPVRNQAWSLGADATLRQLGGGACLQVCYEFAAMTNGC